MLRIENLDSGYGKYQVIYNLSLHVAESEIVAVIGPNGAGKSTILKAICGLLPVWKGDVLFNGQSTQKKAVSKNIMSGIIFSPQGNRIFDELQVIENLEVSGYWMGKDKLKSRIDSIFEMFPILKQRFKQNAGTLSGGEQQMLALARALIPEPQLLLLDEPSMGLAPNLVSNLFDKLKQINAERNIAMLVVEQKVKKVLTISKRVYSIKLGRVAFDGKSAELIKGRDKLKDLFL